MTTTPPATAPTNRALFSDGFRRELVSAAAGLAATAGITVRAPEGLNPVAVVLLAVWLVTATWIAVVDAREHRIPNPLVAALTGISLLWLATAAGGGEGLGAAVAVIGWATAATAAALALHVATKGAMGMGDVKLVFPVAVVIGWLGSETVWVTLLVTLVAANAVVGWRAIRRADQGPVPLAPAIVVGVTVALLATS